MNETVISYARFQPDCGPESPFVVPSEQFRRENLPPPDDQATKTKERTESNEPERRVSQQVAEGR